MRLFNVLSYESLGESRAAEFLFCPSCQVERTIELRSERTFLCVFKIPLYATSEQREFGRCVTCRCRLSMTEFRAADQEATDAADLALNVVAASFLKFSERESQGDVRSLVETGNQFDIALIEEDIELQLEAQPWGEQDFLIWISRNCDRLDLERRQKFFRAAKNWASQNKGVSGNLDSFGVALGLGQDAINSSN